MYVSVKWTTCALMCAINYTCVITVIIVTASATIPVN